MIAAEAETGSGAAALAALREGGKRGLARALASAEARPDAPETLALLDAAQAAPLGHVIGLTGPPGVGKSSLANRLIASWRARGLSVAVVAVDPSSRASGGALLGDRTRLETDPEDVGVFVRSMAARERLGGLAALTWPAVALMRALFDRVLVETVGVGQSETEVADLADTVILCVQPSSGDALQFMKSGVMETPHLLAVTKSDLGAPARRALADLKGALSLAPPRADGSVPEALGCSSVTPGGWDALIGAVEARIAGLPPAGLARARALSARSWAETALREQFGAQGLAASRAGLGDSRFAEAPFATVSALRARLAAALEGAFVWDR